ncbi:holo-ACP synthase [Clostridium baratii]|uniref:Holo-[acyl-carrier-protein] synthase n=1 Tax=Clostridium baratii TaxID=1561 RepID=A0A174T2C9_9CLOT|nr:holo-ACP synthase [Clostridium baratii]CUQ03206.1 4'-phosphopantetheinyl transferase [Clostridium baratii]
MIFGIGTDIIEIERIEIAIKRNPKFLEKMFTEREIELFKGRNFKNETIAGSFCVKEAVSKGLGTGIRGFAFKDIEVLRDSLGKPEVILGDKITNIINNKLKVHASISHNNDTAIAFVVIEEE